MSLTYKSWAAVEQIRRRAFAEPAEPLARTLSDFAEPTPEKLAELARDRSSQTRYAVAQHGLTPAETLSELLIDSDAMVRWAAAKNPGAPRSALAERLAVEPDAWVRSAIQSALVRR